MQYLILIIQIITIIFLGLAGYNLYKRRKNENN